LGIIGYLLDTVEDNFQPLKDVTTATQSSILNMLGSQFKPVLGLVAALILGLAAGIGEELLFRGVLQYQLSESLDSSAALAISSIIFGLLHAVTPLYALLATLASLYFGWLYLMSDNLVVPIATHAFYDFVALMYAHYTVTKMSTKEQEMLADWRMGSKKNKDDNVIL
jgi:membrane protease YdiL (CAAX protease family)